MAFDPKLASRVRSYLEKEPAIVEKKMFGGLAFLLNGNMSVGIHGDELMVRVAPETTDAALKESGVQLFSMSGRTMKGWLLVGGKAIDKPTALGKWIDRGVAYAKSLPPK